MQPRPRPLPIFLVTLPSIFLFKLSVSRPRSLPILKPVQPIRGTRTVFAAVTQTQKELEFRRIIDIFVIIRGRMKAASERLERLTERLNSRQAKLANRGGETLLAERLLNQARTKLKTANQEILNLDIAISQATNSSPPHSEIRTAINQVTKTKTALIDTLGIIKKTTNETRRISENI